MSTRTMELFRRWGVAGEVLAAALPWEEHLHFFVGETLTAREFTTLCAQEVWSRSLRSHAERFAKSSLRFGAGVTQVEQEDGRVVARLVDETGRGGVVRARYIVGADGVGSAVRRLCGVPLDGPDALCRNINVLFEAGLRAAVADRLSLMYTVRGGYFMAVENDRRWLLNLVNPTGTEDLVAAVRAAVGLRILGFGCLGEIDIASATGTTGPGPDADRHHDDRLPGRRKPSIASSTGLSIDPRTSPSIARFPSTRR